MGICGCEVRPLVITRYYVTAINGDLERLDLDALSWLVEECEEILVYFIPCSDSSG